MSQLTYIRQGCFRHVRGPAFESLEYPIFFLPLLAKRRYHVPRYSALSKEETHRKRGLVVERSSID